jgi:hypothetical protein
MPPELVQLIGQFGTWVVFLYLYLSERKRNSEIQDARIQDCREFEVALMAIIDDLKKKPENPTP